MKTFPLQRHSHTGLVLFRKTKCLDGNTLQNHSPYSLIDKWNVFIRETHFRTIRLIQHTAEPFALQTSPSYRQIPMQDFPLPETFPVQRYSHTGLVFFTETFPSQTFPLRTNSPCREIPIQDILLLETFPLQRHSLYRDIPRVQTHTWIFPETGPFSDTGPCSDEGFFSKIGLFSKVGLFSLFTACTDLQTHTMCYIAPATPPAHSL